MMGALPSVGRPVAAARSRHVVDALLLPTWDKVVLWRGDLTQLRAGAVVNAANTALRRGGGICGALHRAAGPALEAECKAIGHCKTGSAVITSGHDLPADHVIHAVGPVGEKPDLLAAAYTSCLDTAEAAGLGSIGFCCISTGIYGYPPERAAPVAVTTVRKWLEDHADSGIKRVVFCVFDRFSEDLYSAEMRKAFLT